MTARVFVAGLLAACSTAVVHATPPAPGFAEAAARLMTDYTDRNQFSGYVLVAHEGSPVFAQGFGFADREAHRASTGTTRFRIGSVTKHFTATAALMLAAQGKLNLEDPIRKYYTSAPATWDAITVRHLLEMRSGIFNLTLVPGFPGAVAQDPTPEKLIELVRDLPLDFAPGTRFTYNNSDAVLLGYVVERASGMSYRQFIEQHVLAPAALLHSGYEFGDVAPDERAKGYEWRAGEWRTAQLWASDLMYSAGALHSTADDLLRWDQMLYGDSLPAKVLRAAAQDLSAPHSYRFGFFVEPLGPHRGEYIGGGQPGFLAFMYRFPEDRVTVILLVNLQSAPLLKIGQELGRLYFALPAPTPPKRVMVTPQQLERYAGTYQLYPGVRLVLSRAGGELTMRRLGGMPPPPASAETLLAVAPNVFVGEDCRIEFDDSGAGPMMELRYIIPRLKTERPARRLVDVDGS